MSDSNNKRVHDFGFYFNDNVRNYYIYFFTKNRSELTFILIKNPLHFTYLKKIMNVAFSKRQFLSYFIFNKFLISDN